MSDSNFDYDLFVIGTGPGGEGAAMQAAKGGLRVAVAERYRQIGGGCTHWGTILGIEATGKRIEYMGAAVFTIRDGKISNVWVLGDVHGLIQQLKTEKEDIEPIRIEQTCQENVTN